MSGLCILYGPELAQYSFGEPHPFGRDRLPAFWEEVRRRGLDRRAAVEPPEMCDEKELFWFHSADYVRFVRRASEAGHGYLDYGDTPAFPGVFEAALRAVGTTLKAVRLVAEGRYRRAFCPMAGLHHARRARAGGFCVFNDIGVAIERLRAVHGIRRIGYVDIDVHHGDGVYYEYESDPDLIFADIHEDGRTLYPGTGGASERGKGRAEGTKLNIPLPPGSGPSEFFEAFDRIEKFMDEARPEMILLQCGADSLKGDPLAHLEYTPECHRHAAARLRALADRHGSGRLLAMGGGGYSLAGIAQAWCAVIEALQD
jgi:acetoin utilization protein AcuC